jgi:hypothetical protein
MLVWWAMMFTLGALALCDSYLDFGGLFRQINSAIFLLASLGLLVRIVRKTQQHTKEKLVERIGELESELHITKSAEPQFLGEPAGAAHRSLVG